MKIIKRTVLIIIIDNDKNQSNIINDKDSLNNRNDTSEISDEEKSKLQQGFQDLFALASGKDWEGLIKLASNFKLPGVDDDVSKKALLTMALSQAILNGAPKETILKIINEGAELSPDVAFAAAVRRDVPIMQMLVEYGLDIHSRDQNGKTVLSYSLVDMSNIEMFDYLLRNGVSTSIQDPKYDLISTIISACIDSINTKHVMDSLLQAGEKITIEHKRLFVKLSKENITCARQLLPYFHNS